jgi:hypothetical protein
MRNFFCEKVAQQLGLVRSFPKQSWPKYVCNGPMGENTANLGTLSKLKTMIWRAALHHGKIY